MSIIIFFFFSSRRRHTRCALVTGVQTCALPICCWRSIVVWIDAFPPRSCRVARETRCIEARDLGILAFAVEQSSQPPRCDRCAITRGEREGKGQGRSEEHTSELQSLMRHSYAVFCLKKTQKYYKTIINSVTVKYRQNIKTHID